MLKAARKKATATGKTLDDILLSIAYGEGPHASIKTADRLAAIKIFKEFTISKRKITENKGDQFPGPTIYLPEMLPDPAKVVPCRKVEP